ncbi:5624_t:CDS:2 [Cetraspora pellucida]|uniref:5624_t:CDS:1 n=1 Tax=Cetraspora pellucida TaxID=1433469 RepID=A0ACA9NR54_9GLOM|nr:5624_t:CDS:2 [Cetraspora pellucida]
MHGGYICSYLHNSGKSCNRSCMHPDDCFLHRRAKKCVPCTFCTKPTASASGCCQAHVEWILKTQTIQESNIVTRCSTLFCISGALHPHTVSNNGFWRLTRQES